MATASKNKAKTKKQLSRTGEGTAKPVQAKRRVFQEANAAIENTQPVSSVDLDVAAPITYLDAMERRAYRAARELKEQINVLCDILSPVMRPDFQFADAVTLDREDGMSNHEHNILNAIEETEQAAEYVRQLSIGLRL